MIINKYIKKLKNNETKYGIVYNKYKKICNNSNTITPEIIKEIISTTSIYNYCSNLLQNEKKVSFISIRDLDDTLFKYIFETNYFINELHKYEKENKLNSIEKNRIHKLSRFNSYEYYIKTISKQKIGYNMTIGDIIDSLNIEPEKFNKLINNNLQLLNTEFDEIINILTESPFNFSFKTISEKKLIKNISFFSEPANEDKKDDILKRFNFPIKNKNNILTNIQLLYDRKNVIQFISNSFTAEEIIKYFELNAILYNDENITDFFSEHYLDNILNDALMNELNQEYIDIILKLKKNKNEIDDIYDNLESIYFWCPNKTELNKKTEKLIANEALYIDERFNNSLFEMNNPYGGKAKVNNNLLDKLTSGIPEEFTDIQKHYFIYKKICQLFSYDEEFFIGDQKNQFTIDHQSLERIEEIDENNNLVVCYDASLLLGLIYNLKFNTQFKIGGVENKKLDKIKNTHQYIEFIIDDYLFKADIATGLWNSDLTSQKIYNRTNNFNVISKLESVNKRINEELEEVDKYFEENSIKYKSNYAVEKFKQTKSLNKESLSFDEKIDTFIDIVTSTNLEVMDVIYLTRNSAENIFTKRENYDYIYIKNNKPDNEDKQIGFSYIFVFNNQSVHTDVDSNTYYYVDYSYKNPKTIKKISLEELQLMFDNNLLSINKKEIPGIIKSDETLESNKGKGGK